MFNRPWALLTLAILCALAMVSCTREEPVTSVATLDPAKSQTGEILIADSSCTACHTTSALAIRRLGTAPAPRLLGPDGIGSRLSLGAIQQRLSRHGDDHGLRMPELFGDSTTPSKPN